MATKRKILVVTSGFPMWRDEGLNVFMLEFAQAIAQHFDVFVLAPKSKKSKSFETWDNLTIYRHKQFPVINAELAYGSGIVGNIKNNPLLVFAVPFFFLMQLFAIRKIVKKHQIEIINAHWIIPQGVTTALYKKMFNNKIKVLSTIQGSDYLTLNNFLGNNFKKLALDNSNAISVVSQFLKDLIGKKFKDKPIYFYPWGVDTTKFSQEARDDSIRKKYDINGPFLLYVGGIIEGKGVRYLIQAMKDLVEEFNEIKVLFIGEGYMKEELIGLSKELGIESHIIFAGVIPNQDLPSYYATADIFLLPSFSEGYPAVVRESLSSEVLSIVTDLPVFSSYPELKEVLFKVRIRSSEDIIAQVTYILKNREEVEPLRKKGREFILQTSDWSVFGENYKKIFDNL